MFDDNLCIFNSRKKRVLDRLRNLLYYCRQFVSQQTIRTFGGVRTFVDGERVFYCYSIKLMRQISHALRNGMIFLVITNNRYRSYACIFV